MAIDYTIPTYSRPDLGWDVPAYIKKYYEDKKAKEDEEANTVVSEGAGVRSDQLYDSADPETRKAVGWGGGPFSQTEVSSGQGDPNVTRYDQWGNEVDMGNRTAGLKAMKIMEKLPQAFIPGYGFAKAVHSMVTKPDQTAASTDPKPLNLLEVVDDTEDEDALIQQRLDALPTVSAPTTNYSWPEITGNTQIQDYGTTTGNWAPQNVQNPLNTAEMGILDMLRQAAEESEAAEISAAGGMEFGGAGGWQGQ